MRCGRILVEGEAEEVTAFPSPRTCRQSRNSKDGKVKSSNPYATRGLDKFATLHEELAAKREYVARKTGSPEDLVRFCYSSNKGWVPVVVKGGRSDPRFSILVPLRRKKDSVSEENDNGRGRNDNGRGGNDNGRGRNDNGCLEMEKGCENHDNGLVQPVGAPWSGYVMTTAFGVLNVSAMLLRKSAVPAAAMAMVMVVGALQKRWQGGVMSMKKFVVSGLSYFSGLVVHWKSKMFKKVEPQKIVENQNQNQNQSQNRPENAIRAYEIKKRPAKSLSISSFPLRGQNESHQSTPKQRGCKSKEYARIVSMNGQPRKPIRSDFHKSENLNRSFNNTRFKKRGVGSSPTVGATVMIIVLICLIFYGKLCAILFTSAWWYLLPKFKIETNNSENGDFIKVDLKQRELRKKKVIMDGLLDRSHNNNNMGRS